MNWVRRNEFWIFLIMGLIIIAIAVSAGIQADKNRAECRNCIQEQCEECMDVCGADE